ncbi:XdhC family protein [Paenibacillus soyae]|uniref:XdhC family protein n=1 Tax=Paenibacillus soyae TaxID=2969249 RepID=A0A9X2SBC5_9BACL|nr:XdhC/CoxI family protein [Paenibacillus soyae]MCR2805508.1 XdhC family protein [Paenibacillus soyae]
MPDSELIKEAVSLGGCCVLATIVHVEGHAYRKAGAMMLLKADGEASGALSPGCLESDLLAHVPDILRQNAPRLVDYDMRPADDLSWGEHIGCGGLIRVLLEPVSGELLSRLRIACERMDAGAPVLLIRRVGAENGLPVAYEFAESDEAADACHREGVLIVRWEPKPRLLLFGAGDDARPLSQLAQQAGFAVTVADFRESLCKAERFPGAKLLFGFPQELMPLLQPGSGDYIVIMSHQLQRDRQFLELVLPSEPRFVGVMGSEARRTRLLGGLSRSAAVSCPAGLPIGADGPFEIAVSIMAELIQARRGGGRYGAGWNRGSVYGSGEQQPHGVSEAFG